MTRCFEYQNDFYDALILGNLEEKVCKKDGVLRHI